MNHQYDKSSEFLDLAGAYVRTYLIPEVRLVSVLKEMWELEVCYSVIIDNHYILMILMFFLDY